MKKNMQINEPELDEDEILKLYLSSPILLDREDFLKSESFQAGVEKASGIAGIYSCLVSNGISMSDAIELIYTMMGTEMSIKIAELQRDATINAPSPQIVY